MARAVFLMDTTSMPHNVAAASPCCPCTFPPAQLYLDMLDNDPVHKKACAHLLACRLDASRAVPDSRTRSACWAARGPEA